jgi:hypothetical protein
MFAKLLVIVLAAGAMACCLLTIRQERIEAAHQMWQTHRRMAACQQTLWDLRSQVFRSCRPAQVRRMLASTPGGVWIPIPAKEQGSDPLNALHRGGRGEHGDQARESIGFATDRAKRDASSKLSVSALSAFSAVNDL